LLSGATNCVWVVRTFMKMVRRLIDDNQLESALHSGCYCLPLLSCWTHHILSHCFRSKGDWHGSLEMPANSRPLCLGKEDLCIQRVTSAHSWQIGCIGTHLGTASDVSLLLITFSSYAFAWPNSSHLIVLHEINPH
jgi:hypothetical protein